jgi:predicted DNA-binding transcriptional regulator YafY
MQRSKSLRITRGAGQAARSQATRPPLARMVRIHDHLSAGRFPNCSNLADEFEVSYKTIQRDIDFMRDQMMLPIDYDSVRHGFHYTKPVTSFPTVNITHGEVVALLVAQKALEQYRGTAFEKPLRAAFEKMTTAMQEEGSFSLQELGQAVSFRPLGAAVQEMKIFEEVSRALLDSRLIEFDYHKLQAAKPERRRVEPYHLGCIGNQWYLIAKDLVRGKLRTFALARLTRPKQLAKKFERPADFSVAKMMSDSFAAFETPKPSRVKIRLDEIGARLASERVWHKTQKIKPLASGGAELTLEVGVAPDLENWIFSWGRHAQVLEPRDLRERVAATARAMALQYAE